MEIVDDKVTITIKTIRNEDGEIEYYIKENTDFELKGKIKDTQGENQYTFQGIENNKKYTIQVIAKNSKGESSPLKIQIIPITFKHNPTEWTNGDVIVTASTSISKYVLQTSKDGETWITDPSQTFTGNGTMYARLWDGRKTVAYTTEEVANIDKLAPNAFTPTATSTTKSITVTASATDAEAANGSGKSGIAGYRFSKDNGSTWTSYQTSGTYTWDNLPQTTNYTIKVEAKDNAGNTKQGSVSKGTGTVETATGGSYTPTTWTNGNVTVTLPTKSGFTTRYTTDGTKPTKDSTQYESTFTVSSNCRIYYLYTDGTNIGGAGTLNVTNIDKLAPNAFTPTATSTANSITVTASATDADAANGSGKSGIAGYRFSLDNGSTWTSYQTSGTYTWYNLPQATDYTIKVEAKDNAGNTKQEVAVTNEYNVSTADQVLCTIGGRNFYKYNNEVAVAGIAYYYTIGNIQAPILVSTLPDAVSYYTTYSPSTIQKTSGNLQYNGRTYYYSSEGFWMYDDENYTSNVKLINTPNDRFDSVKSAAEAILKKYYTIRTKLDHYHIPTGFSYKEGTVDTGYVITDGTNEFVWIPVASSENYTKKLGTNNRYVASDSSDRVGNDSATALGNDITKAVQGDTLGVSSILGTSVTSTLSNQPEAQIVNNAGGFWVGRYEAGVANEEHGTIAGISGNSYDSSEASASNTYWEGRKTEIVVKQDAEPVRNITQAKALEIANNWKSGEASNEKVAFQSGLITGTQWDVMCNFIGWDVCDSDCLSWGNYMNEKGTSYTGFHSGPAISTWLNESGVTKNSRQWIFPTGKFVNSNNGNTAKKNIYDVAGNVWEWTTEVPQYSASNRVQRGGTAWGNSSPHFATYRQGGYTSTVETSWDLGFRIVLYVQ